MFLNVIKSGEALSTNAQVQMEKDEAARKAEQREMAKKMAAEKKALSQALESARNKVLERKADAHRQNYAIEQENVLQKARAQEDAVDKWLADHLIIVGPWFSQLYRIPCRMMPCRMTPCQPYRIPCSRQMARRPSHDSRAVVLPTMQNTMQNNVCAFQCLCRSPTMLTNCGMPRRGRASPQRSSSKT